MEKEPIFKRPDYLTADEKNFYCAFLVANDPDFAFPDMKTFTGKNLIQRVQYANIVLVKKQRKPSDICHKRGDCANCETFKDYDSRARIPDKHLQHIPGSLQCIE